MRLLKLVFSKLFICIFFIAALVAAIIFLCLYIHSLLPVAAAFGLYYLLSVIAALSLMLSVSPPPFKCAWLIAVIALPVGGAVLYFLSYLSRCEHGGRTAMLPPCGCDSAVYYFDGAALLDGLIKGVSEAEVSVRLEFYIFAKGKIWKRLDEELKKALARGCRVMIIYDGLGSALRAPKRDFRALSRLGAQIKVFNRILPLPVSRLNFRDHRKIAAIDGKRVFIGGVNIADEYANLTSPHGHWKDGGALLTGQIAEVYENLFDTLFDGTDLFKEQADARGSYTVTPICDRPEERGSNYENAVAAAIYAARKRVWVFTPYLCMGDKLSDALIYASERGVDVKIIIPYIPDKKLTYLITLTCARELSENGVGVWLYSPGFMHFKGVLCDGKAFLGSYNFDFRSMWLNHECGVCADGVLASELAHDFERTLGLCSPLKPPTKIVRFAGKLLYLFAPLV